MNAEPHQQPSIFTDRIKAAEKDPRWVRALKYARACDPECSAELNAVAIVEVMRSMDVITPLEYEDTRRLDWLEKNRMEEGRTRAKHPLCNRCRPQNQGGKVG